MKKLTKSITVLLTVLFIYAQFPVSAEVGDVTLLWSKNCQKCHGKDGKGNTKSGKMFKVKDLTDAEYLESLKDEQMHKSIKEGMVVDGKTKMKPFADKLTDEEITALIAFVREFSE